MCKFCNDDVDVDDYAVDTNDVNDGNESLVDSKDHEWNFLWFGVFFRGGGKMRSQNHGPWPPKPNTWDRYKVFLQKRRKILAKKKSFHGNITFWTLEAPPG